jgi:hypothetical protein
MLNFEVWTNALRGSGFVQMRSVGTAKVWGFLIEVLQF